MNLSFFLNQLFFVFWFFLPVGVANMAPIFAAHLPFLKRYTTPLDYGKKWQGRRIFGDHKTIRGLTIGIVTGIVTVYLQQYLYQISPFLQKNVPLDYSNLNPIVLGTLSGAGALIGDLIKSFFKRRANIKAGTSWIPYDQIDYIIGGSVLTSLMIPLSLFQYTLALLLFPALHLLISYFGFLLHLKKSPL